MTHSNPSRRLLAGTVALAIATIAGPLTLPAVADAGSGAEAVRTASGATGAAVLPPLGITLVSSSVPAVATLDPAPWKARWQLSRPDAEVTLTLRHTATGIYDRSYLYPSSPAGPVRMDGKGLISMDWTGWTDSGSAPNGSYTWQLVAKPLNGLGPDLTVSGTFKVTRRPAPHDHTDNGSPDLLARDSAGVLWREDTFHVPWSPKLHGTNRVKVGGGWTTYNRIAAVGNIAGGPAGDLVARDKSGVLWLFQGTGKGGFTARARIGSGWNAYTQLIGIGDSNVDGKQDLLAIDQKGYAWRYRGTGNAKAPFAAREAADLFFGRHYNTIV